MYGNNTNSKDRDILIHLQFRISIPFCIYSMRGLEKGKNKGNKETRETFETKGMKVREKEYGRRTREE